MRVSIGRAAKELGVTRETLRRWEAAGKIQVERTPAGHRRFEVSKCSPQESLRNLDEAYVRFFRRVEEKKAGKKVKVGFPKFKSKKNGLGGSRLTGAIHVFDDAVQLPRLGRLRLKERGYLPTRGAKVLSAAVSERAGRWYVSIPVEMEMPEPAARDKPVVGVDLGVRHLATLSDGVQFENPRALRNDIQRIKRLQRMVSRREKGGANRKRAVAQLARAHLRVANVRKDALHQVTSLLAKTKSAVVLEDLNVSGLLRNHHLAQAIADVGLHEFRRQLTYKGEWHGCKVFFADPFYPSTKRCSNCGNVKADTSLGERVYACDVCGFVIDRDLNAALNLERLVSTGSSPGSHACGEGVRPGMPAVLHEAGTEPRSALG
jgi:putative transposase